MENKPNTKSLVFSLPKLHIGIVAFGSLWMKCPCNYEGQSLYWIWIFFLSHIPKDFTSTLPPASSIIIFLPSLLDYLFFFLAASWHVEVPGPGVKPPLELWQLGSLTHCPQGNFLLNYFYLHINILKFLPSKTNVHDCKIRTAQFLCSPHCINSEKGFSRALYSACFPTSSLHIHFSANSDPAWNSLT